MSEYVGRHRRTGWDAILNGKIRLSAIEEYMQMQLSKNCCPHCFEG